jgi:hypothetical protein
MKATRSGGFMVDPKADPTIVQSDPEAVEARPPDRAPQPGNQAAESVGSLIGRLVFGIVALWGAWGMVDYGLTAGCKVEGLYLECGKYGEETFLGGDTLLLVWPGLLALVGLLSIYFFIDGLRRRN